MFGIDVNPRNFLNRKNHGPVVTKRVFIVTQSGLKVDLRVVFIITLLLMLSTPLCFSISQL